MLRRSPLLDTSAALARRAAIESRSALYAWRAGMLALERPDRALAIFRAMDRLGQLGAAIAIAAIRHGERIGLVDELGSVTFAELDGRSSALACGLRARGLRPGDCVGILCRNHRGFLDATFAAAKVGARTLYLNTDFAGPQLRDVCEREGVALLIHDAEYEQLVASIEPSRGRLLAWTDVSDGTVEALITEQHRTVEGRIFVGNGFQFDKGNLARYKVPRDVTFLPELPRNPTGKVLKRQLREMDAGAAS